MPPVTPWGGLPEKRFMHSLRKFPRPRSKTDFRSMRSFADGSDRRTWGRVLGARISVGARRIFPLTRIFNCYVNRFMVVPYGKDESLLQLCDLLFHMENKSFFFFSSLYLREKCLKCLRYFTRSSLPLIYYL